MDQQIAGIDWSHLSDSYPACLATLPLQVAATELTINHTFGLFTLGLAGTERAGADGY
jgi:hypothetical protein